MFFIGVFGIENKDKELKTLDNLNCNKCNLTVSGKIIKNYDYFHFFFIPLLKWNERYYVICNRCNTVYGINKEKGKAIEHGENINLTYWDLKEMNENEYFGHYFKEKICRNCGNKVDGSFNYCPHCGAKI